MISIMVEGGYPLKTDLILLYDLDQLQMISHVYEGQVESDAFVFKNRSEKKKGTSWDTEDCMMKEIGGALVHRLLMTRF